MRVLYVDTAGRERRVDLPGSIDPDIERMHAVLAPEDGCIESERGAADCVLEAASGILAPTEFARVDAAVASGRRAWLYYPAEHALERIDAERVAFHRRLGTFARFASPIARLFQPFARRPDPLAREVAAAQRRDSGVGRVETGDEYKDAAQDQWDFNPAGSHYAGGAAPHTREWFEAIERHRYRDYAPWMPSVMEFDRHAGADVLEIGGGLGTDLSQFARHGARVTDVDLSVGHLRLAQENFTLRGLKGRFVHHDAERLPFDAAFDLVYTNGVLHHTPDTARLVGEIRRVLRPGGRVIAMVYAERSVHFWYRQVFVRGLVERRLRHRSIGDVLSETVEVSTNDARPLVKVYTRERLARLFSAFGEITITQHQLTAGELPLPLRPFRAAIERRAGWNLVIKAVRT